MAIKRAYEYDKRNDVIHGVSPLGLAAKRAMVVMARGLVGRWKQVSQHQHLLLYLDHLTADITLLGIKLCPSRGHRLFFPPGTHGSRRNCRHFKRSHATHGSNWAFCMYCILFQFRKKYISLSLQFLWDCTYIEH